MDGDGRTSKKNERRILKAVRFLGYALTAGLRKAEALETPPSMIMDLYLQRREYDDQLHGIKRKRLTDWSDD